MSDKTLVFQIKAEGDAVKTLADIDNRLKQLSESKKALQKEYQKEGKLTREQQTEYKKLSAEAEVLSKKKAALVKETRNYAQQATTTQGSMARLRAETAALRAANENLNLSTESGRKKFEQNSRQIVANTAKIRDYDRSISGSTSLVGEYSKGFAGLGKQLLGAAGLMGGAALAVKGFSAVINSSQSVSDKFAIAISGLKFGFDAFARSIATMDFSNFFTNVSEAVKMGIEYAKVLDELADRKNAVAIREAEARLEIAQSMKVVRDMTKTDAERIDAAKNVLRIEDDIATARKTNAEILFKEELKIAASRAKISEDDLKNFLRTYDQTEAQRKSAERLIEAEDNLKKAMRGRTDAMAQGQSGEVIATFTAQIEGYQSAIKGATDEDRKFAESLRGFNRLSDATDGNIEKLKTAWIDYSAELASFDEKTGRVESRMSALLDEQTRETEIATDKISKKAEKNTDDLVKSLEKAQQSMALFSTLYYQQITSADEQSFIENIIGQVDKGFADMMKGVDQTNKDAVTAAEKTNKDLTDATLDRANKEAEEFKIAEENKKLAADHLYDAGLNALDGFYAVRLAKTRSAMQKELQAAGDNEAAKEAIMKKYAQKEQKIAVKKALIDMALMMVSAGLTKPFIPVGLAAMISAGVMGGTQVAAIKAQQFATGGSVKSGHELPGFSKSQDNTLALVKPGEVILNSKQQMSLGGPSTFRKIGVPGFADGGVVGAPVTVSPTDDMNRMIKSMIDGINEKDVVLNIHKLYDAERELNTVTGRV
jgi:hypothetical protein